MGFYQGKDVIVMKFSIALKDIFKTTKYRTKNTIPEFEIILLIVENKLNLVSF